MSPRALTDDLLRPAPLARVDEPVESALRRMLDARLPALPVVDGGGRLRGIFGEREFVQALFPGYLGEMHGAAFVGRSLEDALEKRSACRDEPVGRHMYSEHIEVPVDYADVQLAEIFLHHRVLLVPVTDDGRVQGVITRSDFVRRLSARLLAP
jgi:CBS domain-containing protein